MYSNVQYIIYAHTHISRLKHECFLDEQFLEIQRNRHQTMIIRQVGDGSLTQVTQLWWTVLHEQLWLGQSFLMTWKQHVMVQNVVWETKIS